MGNYRPQRSVWQEDDARFVNPYTFLPVRGNVDRKAPANGSLNGRIHCQMTAVTPVAIPDAERKRLDENVSDHYIYPFYSVGESNHIIPGSSLRGVIRNMFEAAANSCFSVNNNNILSARHSFPRRPGILVKKNGEWKLYSASVSKDSKGQLGADKARRVWYDIKRSKNTTSVFTMENEVECSGLDKAVNDLRECLEIYRKNAEKEKTIVRKLFDNSTNRINENGLTPLFFELVGEGKDKTVYLSPAQISRSVFHNKLNDLLGDHQSCQFRNDESLCDACALFGTLRKNGKAYAGKVRIGDAEEISFISGGYHTLRELSSPKTTSVEFYSERPENAKVWNYDYKTTEYRKLTDSRGRKINSPKREMSDIHIKGRKFYLNTDQPDYETSELTKRNSTMELADKNSSFGFDVYFDGITEQQLSDLVWVLTLGENDADSKRLYKIGHGKPLGLGSVKIVVENVTVRDFDRETLQYSLKELDAEKLIENSRIKISTALEKIVSMETAKGMKVSYPIAEDKTKTNSNSSAAHQWFIANRTIKGTGTAWNVNHTLPDITDKDISLPAYVKDTESVYATPKQQSFGNDFGGGSIMIKGKDRQPRPKNDRRNKKPKW